MLAKLLEDESIQHFAAHAIALQLLKVGKLKQAESVLLASLKRSPRELGRDDVGLPVTEAQYQASAKLVRFLCQELGVPVDRDHIKGHCEAAKTTHEDCPNRIWDWKHYMELLTKG